MSNNNPLTTKRHKRELASMIFGTMKNENTNLLQATGIVMRLVTDDEVQEIVKKMVNEYNGVQA